MSRALMGFVIIEIDFENTLFIIISFISHWDFNSIMNLIILDTIPIVVTIEYSEQETFFNVYIVQKIFLILIIN